MADPTGSLADRRVEPQPSPDDRTDVFSRPAAAILAVLVAAAVVVRVAPLARAGALGTSQQYDDSVMFGASSYFVHGLLPYRDVVFLHPPGVLLWVSPFAALAETGMSDNQAMGFARLAFVLVGALNTYLVGLVLIRRGTLPMAVGSGLYAAWGATVQPEQTIYLEPLLNLGLLGALALLRSRRRGRYLLAGAALGLALASKYWAAVDVLVLLVALSLSRGRRAAARFILGVLAGAGAVGLPFFALAPRRMWELTVSSQLGRPELRTPATTSAGYFSPALGFAGPNSQIPGWTFLLGIVVLVLVSGWLIVTDLRRRQGVDPNGDALIAILLLTHVGILFVASPTFYFHYASWAAAPIALLVGIAVARLSGAAHPLRLPAALVLGATLVVMGFGSLRSAEPVVSSSPDLTTWADSRRCVWGTPADLIEVDALTRNAENECVVDVDPFGAGLTLGGARERITADDDLTTGNPRWRARAWAQLNAADGAILPADRSNWWFSPDQTSMFEARYVLAIKSDGLTLWSRRGS